MGFEKADSSEWSVHREACSGVPRLLQSHRNEWKAETAERETAERYIVNAGRIGDAKKEKKTSAGCPDRSKD